MLALAADAPAARAAGGGRAAKWSGPGASAGAVWGLCRGGGAQPYRVVVDLEGPAYPCSCPSRKIPCKHALGLLLLWSVGAVQLTESEGCLGGSRAGPRLGSGRPGRRGGGCGGRAGRRERRAERVGAGVAELEVWLADRVRRGLGGFERGVMPSSPGGRADGRRAGPRTGWGCAGPATRGRAGGTGRAGCWRSWR